MDGMIVVVAYVSIMIAAVLAFVLVKTLLRVMTDIPRQSFRDMTNTNTRNQLYHAARVTQKAQSHTHRPPNTY